MSTVRIIIGSSSDLTPNEVLTLAGVSEAAFACKAGSRSALEWVTDQYQVKTDNAGNITSDPNEYSEPSSSHTH